MNVFTDVVRNIDGVIVAGANVYIYGQDGQEAELFALDGVTPADNPIVSDDKGEVSAKVADDGFYTARYYWGGRKRYVERLILGLSPVAQAEAAADTAVAVVGPTYTSTALGLAATTSGQSFAVNTGDSIVSIYRNNAGSAVLQRSLGTTAYNDARFAKNVDLAATTGASLIGVNDGASGSKYTTVQGYRDYLLAGGAGTALGWTRPGVGTSPLSTFLDGRVIYPEEFGALALEDGASSTASQSTPMKNALESGRIVDCRGKSYVIGDMVDPTDGVAKGLINGNFVRALANQTNQNAMFNLINQPNIKVRNNSFDYGATENAGSNDDSSRFLITVGSNDATTSTWVRGIEVTNNRFTGGGNGTPLYARGTIGALIANNTIVERVIAGSATNDAQNGIDYSYSRGAIVTGNFIDGLYYRVAGNLVRQYSRGIVAVETSNAIVSGNYITNVDQGIDFSGGISASLPNGNFGISCVGNVVTDVRTWGIKFANCIRHSVCSGNVVRNFGWGGIVVSGQSSAGSWGDKPTSHLLITGNYVFDPADYFGRSDCIGIWIIFRADFPGYPNNIRITNNTVANRTGNGRLLHGISQDDGDGAHNVVSGAPYNEVSGNKISGQTGTPTKGCFPDGVCAVTGSSSQSIPDSTWTAVAWNSETVDGEGMHDNSTNPERITVSTPGWYKVDYTLVYAASSSGFRQARFIVNGGTIPGGDSFNGAGGGSITPTLSGSAIVYIPAGNHARIETWQSSGGALNLNRPNSQFSVRRIEQM